MQITLAIDLPALDLAELERQGWVHTDPGASRAERRVVVQFHGQLKRNPRLPASQQGGVLIHKGDGD